MPVGQKHQLAAAAKQLAKILLDQSVGSLKVGTTVFVKGPLHEEGGWSTSIAKWPQGLEVMLYLDKYRKKTPQTYWVGFTATIAEKLKQLCSCLPIELLLAAKFDETHVVWRDGATFLNDYVPETVVDTMVEERFSGLEAYLGYYSSGTTLDLGRAAAFIRHVVLAIDRPDDERIDVELVEDNDALSTTTKKRLIDARRGQGKFRANLDKLWSKTCPVTSHVTRELCALRT